MLFQQQHRKQKIRRNAICQKVSWDLSCLSVLFFIHSMFSHVLTGLVSYKDFMIQAGKEASVTYAIQSCNAGLQLAGHTLVTVAISCWLFISNIGDAYLGQTRVFYTMSTDGLIPPVVFSEITPKIPHST